MATDLSRPGVPCVAFALRREAAPFGRRARTVRRFAGAPCPARLVEVGGRPVLVLETGVGAQRVRAAAEWLMGDGRSPSPLPGAERGKGNPSPHPPPRSGEGERMAPPSLSGEGAGGLGEGNPSHPNPPPLWGREETTTPPPVSLLISAGFCGALSPSLNIGDVVRASEVIDTQGNRWATHPPPSPESVLLTACHLVSTPEEKRELARRHSAVAVDMESAEWARWCAAAGIPFAAVRALSDTAETALSPRLVRLLGRERVSVARLVGGLIRSPGLVAECVRLARHTRRAAVALREALTGCLTAAEERPVRGAVRRSIA